jgi:dienelactone hydrolase
MKKLISSLTLSRGRVLSPTINNTILRWLTIPTKAIILSLTFSRGRVLSPTTRDTILKALTLSLTLIGLMFKLPAQKVENITFQHEGLTAYGSFIKPDSGSVFPTIIINPGSGSNDRNGTIYMAGERIECLYPGLVGKTLLSYRGLANALVSAGYAVLIYDELGYTYTNPNVLGELTYEKIWLQANSAVDYLKTRNDVNKNRIILMGHSEGASIIPQISSKRNDIAGLVAIGGTRTPLDTVLSRQILDFAFMCNEDTVQAKNTASQLNAYFSIVRSKSWNSQTPPLFGVKPELWHTYLKKMDSVSIFYNKSNTPTLFIAMELDYNIPPSELVRFEQEITTTNDFWMIDSLNHYMTTMDNPNVSKTLTDTIVYWLRGKHLTSVESTLIQAAEILIYPNPIHQNLIIDCQTKDLKINKIQILNTLGMIVFESNELNENELIHKINFSTLPFGIYYIRVYHSQGQLVRKLIKN